MNIKVFILSFVGVAAIAGGLLFLLSGNSASSPSGEESNTSARQEQRQIPNLTLQDYEGNTVVLTDFVGKPAVVNSWAKWCPFCVDELPDFVSLQKEFGDDVVFIAIDRAEPLSAAKGFTDSLGITNDMIFLLDPSDDFYRAIGGFTMPETLFVDREGNIQFHKRGVMGIEEIRQRVQELL
jgi:thiol-disulfide isomerase/thioredoxin